MNEQLQKALAELLGKTNVAGEFIIGEMPDVIQQLLEWRVFINSTWSIVWFMAGVFVLYLGSLKYKDDPSEKNWVPYAAFSVPLILGSLLCLKEVIKISIAPKVWLIEYAAKLAG